MGRNKNQMIAKTNIHFEQKSKIQSIHLLADRKPKIKQNYSMIRLTCNTEEEKQIIFSIGK